MQLCRVRTSIVPFHWGGSGHTPPFLTGTRAFTAGLLGLISSSSCSGPGALWPCPRDGVQGSPRSQSQGETSLQAAGWAAWERSPARPGQLRRGSACGQMKPGICDPNSQGSRPRRVAVLSGTASHAGGSPGSPAPTHRPGNRAGPVPCVTSSRMPRKQGGLGVAIAGFSTTHSSSFSPGWWRGSEEVCSSLNSEGRTETPF